MLRTLIGSAATIALSAGVLLAPAEAHHCKGAHASDPSCDGGGGGGGSSSGKSTLLQALVTPDAAPTLEPDQPLPYVDGVGGVKAHTGGQTQPSKPGIVVELRGKGKDPRTIHVNVTCTNPDVGLPGAPSYIGGETGCADFQAAVDAGEREQVFDDQRAGVKLAARPYEVECPSGGECLDVFTLPLGETEQMGFQTRFEEQILLEFASAIGGADAPNPGRCLSVLSEDQRAAYLGVFCGAAPHASCNVDVTAVGQDTEGRNNSWDIVADGDTGLICSMLSGDVHAIGVATGVSFSIAADALE